VWSGRPNPHLVSETSELAPGRAIDVGCGEGGDAIWLARQGWQVIGADISPVGLERAARNAGEAGAEVAARITWRQLDLFAEAWEPLGQRPRGEPVTIRDTVLHARRRSRADA
jgi:SAM-dependent methyltransferase